MYNKSDFEWVQPKLKSKLAISIPNEHDFNINPRLLAEIPERIGIGYNLQNMTLALSSIPAVVHDIFLLHTHSFYLVAFFCPCFIDLCQHKLLYQLLARHAFIIRHITGQ